MDEKKFYYWIGRVITGIIFFIGGLQILKAIAGLIQSSVTSLF